jgi:carbonic anhydrase
MKEHYWEDRLSLTPEKALTYLKEGNLRFLNNLRVNRNTLQLLNETAEKQFPFAAILSCSDSRVPVELVFDQGLGDIFSVRLAGNIASLNAIGSIEYSITILGSKLVVVLGHSSCGAVSAACDDIKMDNLNELLSHIHPAVEAETTISDTRNSTNKEFVNKVGWLNVKYQIKEILEISPIIREAVQKGEAIIAGAMYDVVTGRVEFLDSINEKAALLYENNEVYQG